MAGISLDGGSTLGQTEEKQLSFLQLIKMPTVLYFQISIGMAMFNWGFQNGTTRHKYLLKPDKILYEAKIFGNICFNTCLPKYQTVLSKANVC